MASRGAARPHASPASPAIAIVQGSSLPPPSWPAPPALLWLEWTDTLRLAQRFEDEKSSAHRACGARRHAVGNRSVPLSWKAQKWCVNKLLNATAADRLRATVLPSSGRRPRLPAAWRAVHAAINYAYAARHGYDLYFADVRGCPRHPSWCAKLCASALLFDGAARQYEWVLVLDEDAFFNDAELPFHAYLRQLDRRVGGSSSLSRVQRSRDGAAQHHAAAERCVVVGKDVPGFHACNAGVVFLRRTEATRRLLVKWWESPRRAPEKNYKFSWFIDQGGFNDFVLLDPEFAQCIEVVPNSHLFGNPGIYTFHNTGLNSGPLCGGPILTAAEAAKGQRVSMDLNRIECLDRIFGPKLRTLLNVPLGSTECGSFRRTIFNSTLSVTFTKYCLSGANSMPGRHQLRFLSRTHADRQDIIPLSNLTTPLGRLLGTAPARSR